MMNETEARRLFTERNRLVCIGGHSVVVEEIESRFLKEGPSWVAAIDRLIGAMKDTGNRHVAMFFANETDAADYREMVRLRMNALGVGIGHIWGTPENAYVSSHRMIVNRYHPCIVHVFHPGTPEVPDWKSLGMAWCHGLAAGDETLKHLAAAGVEAVVTGTAEEDEEGEECPFFGKDWHLNVCVDWNA